MKLELINASVGKQESVLSKSVNVCFYSENLFNTISATLCGLFWEGIVRH